MADNLHNIPFKYLDTHILRKIFKFFTSVPISTPIFCKGHYLEAECRVTEKVVTHTHSYEQ